MPLSLLTYKKPGSQDADTLSLRSQGRGESGVSGYQWYIEGRDEGRGGVTSLMSISMSFSLSPPPSQVAANTGPNIDDTETYVGIAVDRY